jgi:prepilin-type processing-associated H-X9-DG protein
MANSKFESTPSANQAAFVNDRARSRVSWATRILAQMERQDIWDRIVDAAASPTAEQPVVPIEVFVCPTDTDVTSAPENAGLTYVANSGAWDWEQGATTFDDGDYLGPTFLTPNRPNQGDTKDNGLFHNLTLGNITVRMSNIKDGAGMTLMLSENVHKDNLYSWFGVMSDQGGEQQFGMVWVVGDDANPPGTSPNMTTDQSRISQAANATSFRDDVPFFCRPASNHPGGVVNVVYADGHGGVLQPSIDYIVYQQLMTPNGAKSVDPEDWDNELMPPNGVIYKFRAAPPLAEKDFQ